MLDGDCRMRVNSPTPSSVTGLLQRGALVLSAAGLMACAAPEPAKPPVTAQAPAPAPAPVVITSTPASAPNPMQVLFDQLTSALSESGVTMEMTASGDIVLLVPSDMSFARGRASVSPALSEVLARVAKVLNEHPATTAKVAGHTDSTGSDAINNRLSLQRAENVRAQLVRNEVSGQRITTEGMGSGSPVADNNTQEGRVQNRRIEIFISK